MTVPPVEVQNVMLVTGSGPSLTAEFMRCGSTRISLTFYGRSDPGFRVVEFVGLQDAEVEQVGQLFAELSSLLAKNKAIARALQREEANRD